MFIFQLVVKEKTQPTSVIVIFLDFIGQMAAWKQRCFQTHKSRSLGKAGDMPQKNCDDLPETPGPWIQPLSSVLLHAHILFRTLCSLPLTPSALPTLASSPTPIRWITVDWQSKPHVPRTARLLQLISAMTCGPHCLIYPGCKERSALLPAAVLSTV